MRQRNNLMQGKMVRHMNLSIKKLLLASTILLMVLSLSACGEPPASPATTAEITSSRVFEPSSPIKVKLSISKLPVLNEPVDLTCSVTSVSDAPNSIALIKLPKGAGLVSGILEWQGDLKANIPVSLSAQIVFKETGHWAIEGGAKCGIIPGKFEWGDLDVIYLDIGAESSTFGWPVSSPPVVRTDKYSVIKTDLEISHPPKLNEPAKLFITTISPVDFPGLSVGILISPKSAVLSGSNSQLTAVPLVPGANQVACKLPG